jgi:hypothetical protein
MPAGKDLHKKVRDAIFLAALGNWEESCTFEELSEDGKQVYDDYATEAVKAMLDAINATREDGGAPSLRRFVIDHALGSVPQKPEAVRARETYSDLCASLRDRGSIKALELVEGLLKEAAFFFALENQASQHVEGAIAMRTGFTGEPPYVGWKGLGLALNEALDERDAMRSEMEVLREQVRAMATQIEAAIAERTAMERAGALAITALRAVAENGAIVGEQYIMVRDALLAMFEAKPRWEVAP